MTRGTGGYFWWISVLFFMTTGLGPMWLFTLNLGFRGTLSPVWAEGRRNWEIFQALGWLKRTRAEAEEMRWKFVGDRRFKVSSCRLVPSLSGLFYENFNILEPRGGNWGFQKLEQLTNATSSQVAIHPNKVISALLSSSPLNFVDLFNLIVWGWIQFSKFEIENPKISIKS